MLVLVDTSVWLTHFRTSLPGMEPLKTPQRALLPELDALFGTLQHRSVRGESWLYGLHHAGNRCGNETETRWEIKP
jgi:hypothetical protein